jgi:ATP phosphoribosyltransferase
MTALFPVASLEPELTTPLILALPKGRILSECGQMLARAGIVPAADYADEDSRRLRFPTDDPMLDVVRVRPFDVATFVAFGGAHIGICGADVLMEFDYPEVYAPLDLGIGKCRVSVAEPMETAGADDPSRWSRVRVATKYPNIARRQPRHPCRGRATEWRHGTRSGFGAMPADRRPGADRLDVEGQWSGRNRNHRAGHQPTDRQSHDAEDTA